MTNSKKVKEVLLNSVTATTETEVASIFNFDEISDAAMKKAFDDTYSRDKVSTSRSASMVALLNILVERGAVRPSLLTSPLATKHDSELSNDDWDLLQWRMLGNMHTEDQALLRYNRTEAKERFGVIEYRHWKDANKMRLDMIAELRAMLVRRLAPKKGGAKNRKKSPTDYIIDIVDAALKRMKTMDDAPFDLITLGEMLEDIKQFVKQ